MDTHETSLKLPKGKADCSVTAGSGPVLVTQYGREHQAKTTGSDTIRWFCA
jgi:hypothetical protein